MKTTVASSMLRSVSRLEDASKTASECAGLLLDGSRIGNIATPTVATIIATDRGGAPLGHAALRDLAHDGTRDLEIKRFYVHPRARGLGLSRALLAELERNALLRIRREIDGNNLETENMFESKPLARHGRTFLSLYEMEKSRCVNRYT